MRLKPAPPPRRREAIIPMINVVFLLLIFFMLSATLSTPEPFEVTLPEGTQAPGDLPPGVLFISEDGRIASREAAGEAALAAVASAAEDPDAAVIIRADARAPAQRIAEVLGKLAGLGVAEVSIATSSR